METTNVKDWSSLMEFLISKYPSDYLLEDIYKDLGISKASFHAIKDRQAPVGRRLQRIFAQLLRDRYGLSLKIMGRSVSLEKSQNTAIDHSVINQAGRDIINKDETTSFLMQRMVELEMENRKLKELLKK